MNRLFRFAALAAVSFTGIGLPALAHADSFTVTYLAPGVQTPAGITSNVETFDSATYDGTSLMTTFNGSSITGTYTGSIQIENAGQFGGAGGSGKYIAPPNGGGYTLTLSSSVDYFGMWFSALDKGNQLAFYNDSTLVYSFSPADYAQLVGACPTAAAKPNYCGNPNSNFLNQDSGQQFAYLNFYDTTGSFNKITFTENPAVGEFESDNHAIAQLAPGTPVVGTPLTPAVTPEPASWIFGITGVAAMALPIAFRRQL